MAHHRILVSYEAEAEKFRQVIVGKIFAGLTVPEFAMPPPLVISTSLRSGGLNRAMISWSLNAAIGAKAEKSICVSGAAALRWRRRLRRANVGNSPTTSRPPASSSRDARLRYHVSAATKI
jgi:hypothetical protein